MKRRMIMITAIALMLLLCACTQVQNNETNTSVTDTTKAQNNETSVSVTDTTNWRELYEERSTSVVVEELKEHFAKNREELEQIALAMFQDDREYPYELLVKRGVLHPRSTDGKIDFSKTIESEAADLVAKYYEKGFSVRQDIFMDHSYTYVDYDVCAFCYDAYLEADGVLTEVRLLYSETEIPEGTVSPEFIILDEHWQIYIIFYPY